MPLLGGVVGLLFLLGFVKNWFFAVPVGALLAMSLVFGKSAAIPGVFVGFVLDLIIALAIGYVTAARAQSQPHTAV